MSTESVKTNIVGHVLEVTLDRPKANAIDLKTSRLWVMYFVILEITLT